MTDHTLAAMDLAASFIKEQQERIQELKEALSELVHIIDAAGLDNLSRGVQLGPTVWYVKASERMDYARAILNKEKRS